VVGRHFARLARSGGKAVAVLPGWHGVAEATPKKPRATPQATPNENMNFGT